MSLTVQDGKLVVRNGALGTTQACCCTRCCEYGDPEHLDWRGVSSPTTFFVGPSCEGEIFPQPGQHEACGQEWVDAVKQWMEDNGWSCVTGGVTESQLTAETGFGPNEDCALWSAVFVNLGGCCPGTIPEEYDPETWLNTDDVRPDNCFFAAFVNSNTIFNGFAIPPCLGNPLP